MKKTELIKSIEEIEELLSMDAEKRQAYIKERFQGDVDQQYSQAFMVGVVNSMLKGLKAKI